jgi:hypothetical protein
MMDNPKKFVIKTLLAALLLIAVILLHCNKLKHYDDDETIGRCDAIPSSKL